MQIQKRAHETLECERKVFEPSHCKTMKYKMTNFTVEYQQNLCLTTLH